MISIVTIVLDGMPLIQKHLPIFQKLSIPWRWYIAEGAAGNTGSTKWCKPQEPRLSRDGTTEYLTSIGMEGGVVTHFKREFWPNKDVMFNTMLAAINEPCVLLEVDSDEIHTTKNIEKIYNLFRLDDSLGSIRIPCRYFVGPDLVCFVEDGWSNRKSEWLRAWRFQPGDRFLAHEPPVMSTIRGRDMGRAEARVHGLTFDHYAYATEKQCAYKEKFYGYTDLVSRWKALQKQTKFPVDLKEFFPFADGGTKVIRL